MMQAQMRDEMEESIGTLIRFGWFIILCLVLGLLAKGHWIGSTAMTMPYVDQWASTIERTLMPLHNGTLNAHDLISPYNGHRLLFSRLEDIGSYAILGHFSNLAECWFNAVLHCVTIMWIGWSLARLSSPKAFIPIMAATLAILCLPFGWENCVEGLQSQAYWFLFFAVATVHTFMVGNRPKLGLLLSVASIFTLASGFLVAVAILFAVLWNRVQRPLWAYAGLLGVIVAGIVLQDNTMVWPEYSIGQHAHSTWQFLDALGKNLSFPFIFWPWFALLNIVPVIFLIRERNPEPISGFMMALYAWVFLQALAIAYARGGDSDYFPPSRYTDYFCLLMLLNVAMLFRMSLKGFSIFWSILVIIGLCGLTVFDLSLDMPKRRWLNDNWSHSAGVLYRSQQVKSVTGFVLPYRDAESFLHLLNNPAIPSIINPTNFP